MKIVLYDFKTAKEEWFEAAAKIYTKKISHFVNFEIKSLKTTKTQRSEKSIKLKSEESELLTKFTKDDFIVLFDERGQSISSEDFSNIFSKIELQGKKRIVCIIGGAYGVSNEVKKKANLTLSLSNFVFNHLVAEIVVLEQIYRAYTIKNRIPYHNI